MARNQGRPVLLVGSVPLSSSTAVFEEVGSKLGGLAKRIPDGETGARKDWVMWQADVVKDAKGLEPGSTRDLQGGYKFTLYKTKPGIEVKFGPLGYAAAAIASFEEVRTNAVCGQNSSRHSLSGKLADSDSRGAFVL